LRLTGHDISLRIDIEAVQMKELAGFATWPADVANLFKRCAIQNRDAFARAVRDVSNPPASDVISPPSKCPTTSRLPNG